MKINEDNYVELMQKGNEKALWYFIDNYGWIVKSLVYNSLAAWGDEQEECMNDAFLAIWENVGKYDKTKAAFTTWAAAVTRYRIMNFMRNRHRARSTKSIEGMELVGEEDVRTDISRYDEEKEFRELLSGLSERDQEIFMKLFWEEMSHEEICRSMGMKKSVLYNRVSRGKKKLRKKMEEDGYGEGYL